MNQAENRIYKQNLTENCSTQNAALNALLITMHDSGKINLSEEILTKDGPLTEEEWSEVRTHPEPGFRIARATEESAHMADDMLARITTMAAMLTVPRSEQIKSSN